MSKVRLLSENWESVQEIAARTGASLDEVNHAVKTLVRKNFAVCLWPKSLEEPMRWRLRSES